MEALALQLQLDGNPLVIAKASRESYAAEAAVLGIDVEDAKVTWEKLKAVARACRSGMARLDRIVHENPRLVLTPNIKRQLKTARSKAGAKSLACGRQPHTTAGRAADATYEKGARLQPWGPGETAGKFDSSLLKRRVIVEGGLCGKPPGEWHPGVLTMYKPILDEFIVTFDKKVGQRKHLGVKLPSNTKQVRFLPTSPSAVEEEDDELPPPAIPTLPEELPQTLAAFQCDVDATVSSFPSPPLLDLTASEQRVLEVAHSKKGLVKRWADNIPLTEAEFARLRPVPEDLVDGHEDYHLNDEIMNAFVNMLNRASTCRHTFVFDSFLAMALLQDSEAISKSEAIARLLKKVPAEVDLLKLKELFFVVNVPKTDMTAAHWYFIRAHLKRGYIAAVDSCGGAHADALRAVQRFLEHLHAEALACDNHPLAHRVTETWHMASLVHRTPQQGDATSCGVYVLIAIWCCMSGVDIGSRLSCRLGASGPTARSVHYWRNRLALALYRGSLKPPVQPRTVATRATGV